MNAPSPRARSLRAKIIALCVALAGVSSLCVAWTSTQFQTRALRQSSTELQLALVKGIARHAEEQVEQTQRDFHGLTHALTQANWGPDAQIAVTKALLESSPRLDELSVYDAQGRFIDRVSQGSTPSPRPSQHPRLGPEVQDQALAHKRWVSPAQMDPAGIARETWVLPLHANGEPTGFVSSPVRLASLAQRLVSAAQLQLAGTPHALYICNLQGEVLASSDTAKAHTGVDPLMTELELAQLPTDQGLAQEIPASEAGAPAQLATVMRLSVRPWIIVAKVPAKAAFAPLTALRRNLLWSILGVLSASLVLSFFLARRVSLPLGALVSMAKRLQRGRFDHTGLLQRTDEIGEVARAMNQAVKEQHLRGTSRSKETREDVLSLGQTPKQMPPRTNP